MAPRLLRVGGVLVVVVLLFYLGGVARQAVGIEFSPESIRVWVESLGWAAPWIYLVLVTLRHFLGLPSAVVLPAGGVLFGTALGTVLGATGVLATASLNFVLGRGIARGTFAPGWLERLVPRSARLQAAGPAIVGLTTAHPLGPMTLFHWGAGFSTLGFGTFALVVAVAALARSFALSFFGASLLEVGALQFWLASALLVGLVLLPFAHPGLRARLGAVSLAEESGETGAPGETDRQEAERRPGGAGGG